MNLKFFKTDSTIYFRKDIAERPIVCDAVSADYYKNFYVLDADEIKAMLNTFDGKLPKSRIAWDILHDLYALNSIETYNYIENAVSNLQEVAYLFTHITLSKDDVDYLITAHNGVPDNDKWFLTSDNLVSNGTISVLKDDSGVYKTVESVDNLLDLNDKQKDAFEKFKEVLRLLTEHNVRLICDQNGRTITAVDGTNIAEVYFADAEPGDVNIKKYITNNGIDFNMEHVDSNYEDAVYVKFHK